MALPKKKNNSASKVVRSGNRPHALHPPYFTMIVEAITCLKDRTGSSQPAIAKFIEDKYRAELPSNFKKLLSVQLKKFVKSEKLFKIKNSYKISALEKAKLAATSSPSTEKRGQSRIARAKTERKGVKGAGKAPKPKVKRAKAKKTVQKAVKTKRLSLVKTPDALKRRGVGKGEASGGKMKNLSEVKTPDGMKKTKKRSPTPMKPKTGSAKKAKK